MFTSRLANLQYKPIWSRRLWTHDIFISCDHWGLWQWLIENWAHGSPKPKLAVGNAEPVHYHRQNASWSWQKTNRDLHLMIKRNCITRAVGYTYSLTTMRRWILSSMHSAQCLKAHWDLGVIFPLPFSTKAACCEQQNGGDLQNTWSTEVFLFKSSVWEVN